jgi:hypothetical protein
LLLALGHDGGTKAGSEVVGKFVKLGAAVNLNGSLGCIANDVAVVAPKQVLVQFFLGAIVDHTVEVVGKLF